MLSTSIGSVRVPNHFAGPFESGEEFNEYIIRLSWSGGFSSESAYNDTLSLAKGIDKMFHHIVFTNGDRKPHNILIRGSQIAGFLDSESAGWYTDY